MNRLKKINELNKKISNEVQKYDFQYFKDFSKHYFPGLFREIDKKHTFFYASALTFDLILCIIPFILIIFSYLGSILQSQTSINQVYLMIEKLIPSTAYTLQIKEIVSERIMEFVEYKTLAGIIGATGIFITCAGLFGSMRTILNSVFEIQQEKNFFIAKLRDFGMVLLVIVFFSLMVVFNPMLQIGLSIVHKAPFLNEYLSPFINSTIVDVLIIIVSFLFFFMVFSLIPYERLSKKVYLMSAIWATILFELAKYGFKYYFNHFVNYSKIYGNFTFLILIALWFYVSSIIFIISAIIGQLYRKRKLLLETQQRKNLTLKEIYSPVHKKIKKTFDNKARKKSV